MVSHFISYFPHYLPSSPNGRALQRHYALDKARLKLRHKPGTHYTPAMLKTAVSLISKNYTTAEICKVSPGLAELLSDMKVVGGGIPGSPWERQQFRRQLRALEIQYGVDGFVWLTINLCGEWSALLHS